MKQLLIALLLTTAAYAQRDLSKVDEFTFLVPNVTNSVTNRRDREIRWYSTNEAPTAFTASGEMLWDGAFTFASRDLPLQTRIRVTYNGKSACFRCNDRGPNHVELTIGGFMFFEDPRVGVLRGAKITILYD